MIAGGLPTCAAAQQVSTITIAAQPLDTALYELAVKANVNILFSPDLIGRLTTKGASGDVRDIPALAQRLLAGTGLVLERTSKGFIIKRGRDRSAKPTRTASRLPGAIQPLPPPTHVATDEILVTAMRSAQTQNAAPLSIALMTASMLEQHGVHGLSDLTGGTVPSLRVNPYASRASTFSLSMRGMTSGEASQISRDGAVGIYQDGVYLGRVQGLSIDFLDLDRIEVLHGPQGTLFGRNAMGGAINLVSRRPGGQLQLTQKFGIEDDNGRSIVTHLDLPRVADISVRLSGLYRRRDGWVDNTMPGEWGWNAYEKSGLRGAALWQPNKDWTIHYAAEYSHARVTGGYAQIVGLSDDAPPLAPAITTEAGRRRVGRLPVPLKPSVASVTNHMLTAEWQVNDAFRIKSITGWRQLHQSQYDQYAGSYLAFAPNGQSGRVSLSKVRQQQVSQELQVNGSVDDISYIVGLYLFKEWARDMSRSLLTFQYNAAGTETALLSPPLSILASERASRNESATIAVFSQMEWTLPAFDDRLSLAAGLRYSIDNKKGQMLIRNGLPSGQAYSLSLRRLDPAISLRYALGNDAKLYVRWGTGYRAGGAHTRSPSFQTFDEETISSWELGLKTKLPQQRGWIALAAYYARYANAQIDFISPFNPSFGETINSPRRGTLAGLEFNTELKVRPNLTVSAAYSFNAIDMPRQRNPFTGQLQRINIAYSPRHAGSLTVDWSLDLNRFGLAQINLNTTAATGAYTSLDDATRSATYMLMNGRITFSRLFGIMPEGLSLAFWGKNLLNEKYDVFDYTYSQPGLTGTSQKTYNNPRSLGIEARLVL
ncbi:TonB-dependent receptor [Caenibius sp. WL]|uniref:TonB-dependent receptor n=1 Tax=Caenibius sp. WL TaxID=2872646 RepID=UPI001C9934A1|nr:TonB-dependent receptor [Caenibius sp. WL]QZP07544.1 TonB-dependent receptor [Caenibius sp. WL]